jgi:hypothetical protein
LFEELDHRKATVYTHPTSANCCAKLIPVISDAAVEYGANTTQGCRAMLLVTSTSFSRTVAVLTAVVERLEIQMEDTPPYQGKFTRDIVDVQLGRFYYDMAQVANAVTIGTLAKLVPISPRGGSPPILAPMT